MGEESHSKVVAIDGPGGSGKSTLSRLLAQKLGLLFIDTGAMYRALAYETDRRHITMQEGPAIESFLKKIKLEYALDQHRLIAIDGVDLTSAIREHHVSKMASQISKIPSVREFLVNFQRQLVLGRAAVMEGRDIGTVVFPRAFCKIYLTAPTLVRARRRLEQLKSESATTLTLEEVIRSVDERDKEDMSRSHSPLQQAKDAILLDTGDMTQNEVLEELQKIVKSQAQKKGVSL